jgi:hypothetical protein
MDVEVVTRGSLRSLAACSRKRHVFRRVVRSTEGLQKPDLQLGSWDSEK